MHSSLSKKKKTVDPANGLPSIMQLFRHHHTVTLELPLL
ncbi:hypothetical protein E6C60_2189 [Paenibacillus algicola]|uniref:Uncharacterized protein n=1 Tax=Paenibacillus algicola TaxID=2565926 RepID=A0A4P8XJR8_9BACL|nr:hypothetical protein E6C60_2189 [Paenibacillus algicola]